MDLITSQTPLLRLHLMAPVPAAQNIRFADVVFPRTSHSATAPIMKRNGPMTTQAHKIDEAAFGVVYGSITVMALLMGVQPPIDDPGHKAILLFGSVFAVAVAKAYAEICERILQSGHAATWSDVRAVWHHSRTVLLAANGPTLAFLLAALGRPPAGHPPETMPLSFPTMRVV